MVGALNVHITCCAHTYRLETCLDAFEGGVAQLGEHLLCKQGVIGSIPFTSTRDELGSVAQLVRAHA